MNNIKRILSLFVCICMLVTLFSGISVVYAAKNGAVIDFEQSEANYELNTTYGLNSLKYVQDGWTVTSRVSHSAQSTYVAEGTHGKHSKVLVVKSVPSQESVVSEDPTQMITIIPDDSNRLSSTSQYFEVEFDLMMNGKSSLTFMGKATKCTENDRGMPLLSAKTGTNKTATVHMASDSKAISLAENRWNNFRFIFQSSDITNDNNLNDDKHKYWVYVNGALVTSGENKFTTDQNGYVSKFFGFDSLDIRMLPDYKTLADKVEEVTSTCELHLDNVSLKVCDEFPEITFSKSINFDGIGEVADTDDAIAAFEANTGFFAPTSNTAGISGLSFVGGQFGKAAKDISAKLYMSADKADVQRLQLVETYNPVMNKGDWYMFEANIAKSGTQSMMGVQQFYVGAPSFDGKAHGMLLQIRPDGTVWVVNNDTGYIVDDDNWHKYTIAIRAGDMTATDDADKNWIKLYVDDVQQFSSEFVPKGRIGKDEHGAETTDEWDFVGINTLWLQNFKQGAYDETLAANSAAYFDDITVAHMGKTKKFDIDILDNKDPVIEIEGAKDGDEFGGDSLPTITATASDDYGIGKFEYYLDGELIETADETNTIVAGFENATGGKHQLKFVAEDIYGISVEKTIKISFVVNKESIYYQNDFEKYSGGLPSDFPQGTENAHGYLRDVTVDEQHGISLAIGVDADTDETNEKDKWNTVGGDTAWAGIPVNNASPAHTVFDFNISNRPAKYSEENGWQTNWDDFYRIYFKASNDANVLYIRPDYIELVGFTMEIGQAQIPYETNKWYNMDVYTKPGNTSYDITITDGETIIAKGTGNSYNGELVALRVAGPYHGLSAGHIAIDNLEIRTKYGMPEFVAPQEGIAGGASEFTVKLTEALMAADVTADTLVVENEFGEVKVKKAVVTGNDLVVTTVSPIIGNMDYTFTLPNTTRFTTGDEVGFVIKNTITTLAAPLGISNVEIGKKTLTYTAANATGEAKPVTFVFQVWNNDGQVVEAKAVSKTIDVSGGSDLIIHNMDIPSGGYITMYIWDGLNKPQAVSPVVYTK